MDKGQVSRTLQVMTKRGLTKMKVIKQRGSRTAAALAAPVVVSVAPKGKALYKQVLPVARRRQADIIRRFSEADRVAFYTMLDKIFAVIGTAAVMGDSGADD
jgi:DNA-binding MarR family transcriptional regulator